MNNSLWSEEEIEVSKNGFLFIVDPKVSLPNEEQPLLLHTTVSLLEVLYPSSSVQDIFLRRGFESDDFQGDTVTRGIYSLSVDERQSTSLVDKEHEEEDDLVDRTAGRPISTKYEKYQSLNLVESLSDRIHSALQDIRNFRHRTNRSGSDSIGGNEKVRLLQNQQRYLLGGKPDAKGEVFERQNENEKYKMDQGGKETKSDVRVPVDSVRNDVNCVQIEDEDIIIKLTRTVNSVRALFPHLLPIFNHPNRSDKNLTIGKIRYKTKRNGPMCWLLGTESFSSCTLKQFFLAQDSAKHILEGFINIELASEIVKDPKGSPSFWPTSWIKSVVERSNPALISPLKVLINRTSANEESIRLVARHYDKIIGDETATQSFNQQYKRAVRKIHQRLSNVLTSRFQGARVSICIITSLVFSNKFSFAS